MNKNRTSPHLVMVIETACLLIPCLTTWVLPIVFVIKCGTINKI